jgi:altronate hydrolase
MGRLLITIHHQDNVGVALMDLSSGTSIRLENDHITIAQDTPKGHKVALKNIVAGEAVVKYGQTIGKATSDIIKGQHVHVHNTVTTLCDDVQYHYSSPISYQPDLSDRNIMAFERNDGEIGIRNEIWVITTVGCVNSTAQKVVECARQQFDMDGIDSIDTFSHPFGCSQLGDDHDITRQTLINLVKHPNAGGVLVLGLGCENNGIAQFKEAMGEYDKDRVKFIISQQSEDEIEDALELVGQLIQHASKAKRTKVPFSKLKVGFKCGGSDGFSGITANPLVGHFSDWHVGKGGTAVLTEVPEMFGAETLLMKRCINEQVFDKTVDMINHFKAYFRDMNQPIYENPSPGNKDGGITTLEDKSLGCIQKGGQAPIVDVLDYGERLEQSGLNLMNGPGNDMVSVTNLIAAGVHLVLFTTGRGTPFGGPVPTLKISSNSELATRKKNWIDFDAGTVLSGESFESARDGLIGLIENVASGLEKSKNESRGYKEISIFKMGVTL